MRLTRLLMPGLAVLAALFMSVAQALPSVDEVQAATRRGDYPAAEQMMREVIAAKPGSAKGHYVLAEILAHQRQFTEALEQARKARSLDPAIKFTDPARFEAFEQLLEREHRAQSASAQSSLGSGGAVAPPVQRQVQPAAPVQQASGGVPVWVVLGGAVVFILVAAAWMRRRAGEAQTVVYPAPAAAPVPAYGGGYASAPVGGAYGYGPAAPAPSGPGLMGVGLAAAGGVAAGMLAEKLLHEGHEGGVRDDRSAARDGGSSAGGLIPGSFADTPDDPAARELTSRDIDFGNGSSWDDGGSGGDIGGGGGSDDW